MKIKLFKNIKVVSIIVGGVSLWSCFAEARPAIQSNISFSGLGVNQVNSTNGVVISSTPDYDMGVGLRLGSYRSTALHSNTIDYAGFSVGAAVPTVIWLLPEQKLGVSLEAGLSYLGLAAPKYNKLQSRLMMNSQFGFIAQIARSGNFVTYFGTGVMGTVNLFGQGYPETSGEWYSNAALNPAMWFTFRL